jgi:hypothetical protein
VATLFAALRAEAQSAVAKGAAMYVGRRLLNERALRTWWVANRKAGEPDLDPNPHITVAYSRTAVHLAPDDDLVVVPPAAMIGFRVLGTDRAVVLEIDGALALRVMHSGDPAGHAGNDGEAGVLNARFAQYREAGATWDHGSYTPHLTLFYLPAGYDSTDWRDGPDQWPPLPDFPLVFGRELRANGDDDAFDQPGAEAGVEKLLRMLFGGEQIAKATTVAAPILRATWLAWPDAESLADTSDEWLYHVTSAANADAILTEGFAPDDCERTITGGVDEAQSVGRSFFTDRGGVAYWAERIGTALGGVPLAVVAIPKRSVPHAEHDALGTQQAGGHAAFCVEGPILPRGVGRSTWGELVDRVVGKRETKVPSPPLRRGLQWLTAAGQRRAQSAADRYAADLRAGRATVFDRVLRDERRDRQLQRMRREDEPPPPTLIDTLAATYRRRLERHYHNVEHQYADVVEEARRDRAEWDGMMESYVRDGGSRYLVTKEWVTAEDERVRHAHAALHGRTIPYDALFQGQHGPVWGTPDGLGCRCRLRVAFPTIDGDALEESAEKSLTRSVGAWLVAKFRPAQHRVPGGLPRGGRWAGSASARAHQTLAVLPSADDAGHYVAVPFPLHQRFEHERAYGRAISMRARPTVESVPLSELHATQALVHRAGVARWIDGRDEADAQPARLMRDPSGRVLIQQGHHEATAARLRGDTHLDAEVYDLASEALWKEWAPTDVPEHIQKALDARLGISDIEKSEDEQRLVTGWALVCTEPDGTPLVDRQNDIVDIRELEQAAHRFMVEYADGGIVHLRDADGEPIVAGRIVESMVVTPELKAALGLPGDTPLGWLVTFHVTSDEVWARVKAGELRMFSIGGKADRVPV